MLRHRRATTLTRAVGAFEDAGAEPKTENLEKSRPNKVREKWNGSQVTKSKALASRGSFKAERTGFEPAAKTQGERVIDERRGAKCGADAAESGAVGADLDALIAAWPTLPEAVKADILAMARANS